MQSSRAAEDQLSERAETAKGARMRDFLPGAGDTVNARAALTASLFGIRSGHRYPRMHWRPNRPRRISIPRKRAAF
jgi:hypothetical protein